MNEKPDQVEVERRTWGDDDVIITAPDGDVEPLDE